MKSLPNIITLSRIPLLFVIAAFSGAKVGWADTAAWAVFSCAAISDYLDGYLARRLGLISNFGKLMDALTDKIFNVGLMIFLLVLPVGAPLLPTWSVWLVVVILARELLITGLRLVAAGSGIVLAAERSGKIKTILQLLAIGGLLLVEAMRNHWGVNADFVDLTHTAALTLFVASAVLTITSGAGYLIKYWNVFMGDTLPPANTASAPSTANTAPTAPTATQ
jgi:CDP-diacylglycerol--glycerol-3-phosphate 3-phosphatidyltransferase